MMDTAVVPVELLRQLLQKLATGLACNFPLRANMPTDDHQPDGRRTSASKCRSGRLGMAASSPCVVEKEDAGSVQSAVACVAVGVIGAACGHVPGGMEDPLVPLCDRLAPADHGSEVAPRFIALRRAGGNTGYKVELAHASRSSHAKLVELNEAPHHGSEARHGVALFSGTSVLVSAKGIVHLAQRFAVGDGYYRIELGRATRARVALAEVRLDEGLADSADAEPWGKDVTHRALIGRRSFIDG